MSSVCKLNPVTGIPDALGNAAGNALSGWWENVATMAAEAHGTMIELVVTWWVHIPTPTVAVHEGPVAQLQRHLAWYMMLAAMLGLVIGATRLALARNGDQSIRETGAGLLKWVFLTGAGTAAVALATRAGDAFSVWIIERSAGGDLGQALSPFSQLGQLIPMLGPLLVIIISLIGTVSAFIQAALMFLRGAMLVLLAGTLPLSAAAGISGGAAKNTLNKHLSWLIAFVLYKPVAAVVYAAAFWMVGNGGQDDIVTQLSGVFMLIMAVAAMPALMRLITPTVGSLTTSGAAGAGAGAAAGTAAATGARMLSSGGSGGSGGGRGGGGGGKQGAAQPGLASPGGSTSSTGGKQAGGTAGTAAKAGTATAAPVAAGITAAQTAGSAAKGATQSATRQSTGESNTDQGGSSPGGATKA